jgi:hypothetical protein
MQLLTSIAFFFYLKISFWRPDSFYRIIFLNIGEDNGYCPEVDNYINIPSLQSFGIISKKNE